MNGKKYVEEKKCISLRREGMYGFFNNPSNSIFKHDSRLCACAM